jgi:hypothetical protein
MAGILGATVNTETEVSQLTRSNNWGGKHVTIAAEAGAVKRGQVMGQITDTYKWVPSNPAATDGSEVARGILGILEDETITADCTRFMYEFGEFNLSDLHWFTGETDGQKAVHLQQLEDRAIVCE